MKGMLIAGGLVAAGEAWHSYGPLGALGVLVGGGLLLLGARLLGDR